jgi:thioredoxin 1
MESKENSLVAIKFSAVWCAPCKSLGVIYDKMAEEFRNITFKHVDVDDQPSLAKEYKIRSVPTVILLKEGQEIDRLVGAVTAGALRKSLRDFIGIAAA